MWRLDFLFACQWRNIDKNNLPVRQEESIVYTFHSRLPAIIKDVFISVMLFCSNLL